MSEAAWAPGQGAPPAGHEPCGPGLAGEGSAEWIQTDGMPADAPLPALLLAAAKVMGTFYGGTVAQAGVRISPAGLGVLRVLLARNGLRSGEVAGSALSSPGTVTSVVDGLVREGYVERRRDLADRRVVRLYVTDEGRAACDRYTAEAGPKWRAAFDFVDPADEPVIRKFLVDMIEHFGELIRKERGR